MNNNHNSRNSRNSSRDKNKVLIIWGPALWNSYFSLWSRVVGRLRFKVMSSFTLPAARGLRGLMMISCEIRLSCGVC